VRHAACIAWLLLAGSVHAADMAVLRYLDQDAGDAPYPTRILVTPAFLRMDGGEDDGDFVLLDRHARRVFNVMREARVTMAFAADGVPQKPETWPARLERRTDPAGIVRYRLRFGDTVCSEGSVAPHAAPDAARALGELKAVLAGTQYRAWRDTPPEIRHDCDLANLVWEAGSVSALGLPLEEREFSGRSRVLQEEAREPLRPLLFQLPHGFRMIDAPS
jgi:hypothetical protein